MPAIVPFTAAVDRLESKTPVASGLRTAEWEQINLGLRDRAFFSAGVDSIRTVAEMQSRLGTALDLTSQASGEALDLTSQASGEAFTDKSKFIADMRVLLGAAPGDTRDLTDLTSSKRLGLIYDFNVEDAREFGRWQAGQDPDILDEFPAQEFLRVEAREQERDDWKERWIASGGKLYDGRMVALKDSEVWVNLSRFGRPWPPFDFGSGMGVEDVDRDTAEQLGLLTPGETVAPTEGDFNQGLQATVPDATPATMEGFRDLFGDQVDVGRDGKVTWQGQRIKSLYDQALADPAVKWSLDLGRGSDATRAQAQAAGVSLAEDAHLMIDADHIRHATIRHGAGETVADQRPLTSLDFQLVPHVWREPDLVRAGDQPGDLVFEKSLNGRHIFATWKPAPKSGNVRLHSLYIKKEGGVP